MLPSPPTILVPELYRVTGGVQVFSRRLIEAADTIYGQKLAVVSRNDRRADCPPEFLEGRKFTGLGKLPNPLRKYGLISACLRARAPWFLSSHPNFAPWLRLQKKPFASVAHGIDVWNIKGSKIGQGLEVARLVLPVSHYTADRLRTQIDREPPITVFPNTFDDQRFTPGEDQTGWRERLDIPVDAPFFLSMCRVAQSEAGKGYHRLLELMPEVLKKHPDLHWVLGGKGDDLENVRQKAKDLGVAENCHFPGFVPDDELVDLYRAASAFILPSKKEGFGIVFLEAAATGLPVIAGNKDGSVDALANGELGTLIDPENNEEILAAISATVDQPASTLESRQALHDACAQRFAQPAFQANLEAVLGSEALRDL